MNLINLGQHYI